MIAAIPSSLTQVSPTTTTRYGSAPARPGAAFFKIREFNKSAGTPTIVQLRFSQKIGHRLTRLIVSFFYGKSRPKFRKKEQCENVLRRSGNVLSTARQRGGYNKCSTDRDPILGPGPPTPPITIGLPCDGGEHEKDAADSAEQQTYDPETAPFCKRRDRSDCNRDLKHGHAAREFFVLGKILFRRGFLVFGFRFDLFLLFLVPIALGFVTLVSRVGEGHFCIEHRSLNALGLIIVPLIGRFDLLHHRFVGVFSRKEPRDRS